ncbi:MAG: hypothetical protein QM564_07105 [Bergeyella sp.]
MKRLFILFGSSVLFLVSCNSVSKKAVENENLKAELTDIYTIDQQYSGIPFGKYLNYPQQESWKRFEKARDSISDININKAENILKQYGFPGINLVGEEGSKHFWIIAQHADNNIDFQKKVLKMMKKEIKKGNANKSDYAYLYDRIRKNEKKKQYFGTQVEYNKLHQATPLYGLEDSINVDKRRAEYNMKPLKEYLNQMTEMHFEMNKEIMLKNNINEPQLYK